MLIYHVTAVDDLPNYTKGFVDNSGIEVFAGNATSY